MKTVLCINKKCLNHLFDVKNSTCICYFVFQSRGSSINSSPKSGSISLSNGSTPSGTPGSRRKAPKAKDTPESSPERTEKMKAAAKAREDARKKMLADRRAAMKQKPKQDDVEIFVS